MPMMAIDRNKFASRDSSTHISPGNFWRLAIKSVLPRNFVSVIRRNQCACRPRLLAPNSAPDYTGRSNNKGRAIGPEIVSEQQGELTTVLRRWSGGDDRAREELVERVYSELKQLARARFAGERAGHTLQPTALVHETYLKLAEGEQVSWQDRVHFIAVSARIMRQILVDSGRRRSAAKRQRDPGDVLLVQAGARDDDTVDILALDQAMARLEALDPAQARVVELRYFGGLTIEETAAAMEISVATVNRYWRAARAWLYLQLNPAHDP